MCDNSKQLLLMVRWPSYIIAKRFQAFRKGMVAFATFSVTTNPSGSRTIGESDEMRGLRKAVDYRENGGVALGQRQAGNEVQGDVGPRAARNG